VVTGVCRMVLLIHEPNSLKEKRHIVKSIIERLKSRFNVSVAETGLNDIWRSAEIGIACVSNDRLHIDSTLSSVINFIENDGRIEIVELNTDVY
jgi:uncharacterized protein YlxP (DUF503 family)